MAPFFVQIGFTQVCGALAAGFGFIALLGWIGGFPLLTTFGSGRIPMAPSTALLFLLFGMLLFLQAGRPRSRKAAWMSMAFSASGLSVALVLFLLSFQGIKSEVEHLGLPIAGEVNGSPIGHMSPLAAFCFILIGISSVLLSSLADRPQRATAAFLSGALILLISLILTMAYLLGGPLLYGSRFIPPALTTSLAFLMLGLAILPAAARRAWPGERFFSAGDARATYMLVFIFVFSATGIVAAGYLHFRGYQKQFRARVGDELIAIAELKVGELVQWRKERLGDAAVLFNNDNFTGLARRFFENREDGDARARLRTWLKKIRLAHQYERVILMDDQGVEQAATPATVEPPAPNLAKHAVEALHAGRVAFLDFYRKAPQQPFRLAVLTPILDNLNEGKPLGVLILRIDPEQYLYPLIRRRPTPGWSAETLLVRREGDEVAVLNDLEFRHKSALPLRFALESMEIPAVMAMLGKEGVVESLDRGGERVMVALRAVPDSPWLLVVSMNLAEINSPLQERLWVMTGLVGALLLGAGAVTGLLWRNQRARLYRERYEAVEAKARSEMTLRTVFEGIRDGILVAEVKTRKFVFANEAICRMLGFSRDEILRFGVADIHPPEDLPHVIALFEKQFRGEIVVAADVPMKRKDGSVFYADINSTPVKLDESDCMLGVFRDITERKLAESRIEHLNRVLLAIRDINQLIVRETERDQLIRMACGILVNHRSYGGALIVLVDEAGNPSAHAQAGLGEEAFRPLITDLDHGKVPPCCDGAGNTTGVYLVTDRSRVCESCPIAAVCAGTDAMCIRLTHLEKTYGYLAVSVEHWVGADPEEQSLFGEVAGDLAYALHNMAVKQAREKLEEQFFQAQKMEAVGRLAGGVAHDFNNLLFVILGYAQIVLEGLGDDHPCFRQVKEIYNAADKAKNLTRQLLAFSRKQVLEIRVIDINGVVSGLEKLLGRMIGEDVHLKLLLTSEKVLIRADASQLEQVLMNLAVNARDAMPDGGVLTIETAVADIDEAYAAQKSGVTPGPHVMIRVSDTGSGMDRATLTRIFEPFFTTKEKDMGTGLGLATSYGIVKQHGGNIWVYSEPGRGTTFRIYFPLAAPEGKTVPPPRARPVPLTGSATILVVEDDSSVRKLACTLLTAKGYRVIESASAADAVALARKQAEPIHLLLTDVVMPGMKGPEVHQRVAETHPGVKVLYMSGYTEDMLTVQGGGLKEGIQFIQKPFTTNGLLEKVAELMAGS